MNKLSEASTRELQGIFRDRVKFSYGERLLYSHDISSLPKQINLLIDTMPEAVVQPQKIDGLIKLLKFANKYEIPLIPRGAGTSGVGGAMPIMGGIVVDFSRMNKILEIDGSNMTVTVQPGVIWNELEKALNKKKLSLRIYPSGAISSTVGGWVAQGGAGIGSFRYKSIGDNIESVQLLLPTGAIKELHGDDLRVVLDCEGITGFITNVKVKLRNHEQHLPILIQYDTCEDIAQTLVELSQSTFSIWNVNLLSPKFIKMENQAEGTHYPEGKYLLLITLPLSKYNVEKEALIKLLTGKGQIADMKLARHKWDNRLYPLRIKSIGPSLIAGEVYMPLKNLAGFLKASEDKFGSMNMGIEGTLANKNEIVLLALVLHDERTAKYTYGWGFPLRYLSLAKKHGGRTYQAGIFLPGEVKDFFGNERHSRIEEFKRDCDPKGIMNTGKLISPVKPAPFVFRTSMRFSGPMLKPLSILMGNYKRPLDVKSTPKFKEDNSFEGLDTWDIYDCAQCGYCATVCCIYKDKMWESASAKGKLYQVKKMVDKKGSTRKRARSAIPDKEWVSDMYCTLCARCETVCHTNIKFHEYWEEVRHWMSRNSFGPPSNAIDMYESIETHWNPFQEPREKRTEWYREEYPLPEKADIVYFIGCMSSYHEYNILLSYLKIFTKAGISFTTLGEDEKCCSAVNLFTGQPEGFDEIARYNIEQVKKRGASTVVTGCPACFRAFHKYKKYVDYDYEILHASQLIARLINENKLKLTSEMKAKNNPVIYHDPCELGRIPELEFGKGIYEEPRFILENVPGIELLEFENRKVDADCCGGGGGLKAVDYDLTARIARRRITAGLELGATTIASMCNNCKSQMSPVMKEMKKEFKEAGTKRNLNFRDISEIVAKAL